jgi:hypothetical protein
VRALDRGEACLVGWVRKEVVDDGRTVVVEGGRRASEELVRLESHASREGRKGVSNRRWKEVTG